MKLLNVSAGTIQTVQIGSEVVKTGHMKSPIAEPWIVTDQGIEGDKRAVHPDKLYAFARDAYDHWGAYLGVEPSHWPDGFFGENLTLDSLDETDMRIGDVFALGDEVKLFATGARNPCQKLTWRLGQPPTFQKVFAKSRRAGVYLGVESIGRVRPGDMLRRIETDPTMPSIADVSAFIINRDAPPLEALRRLLAFERLSPTNRMLLSAKLEAAEKAADAIEGRWRGWRPFTVSRIVAETSEIRSVELVPNDTERLCLPKPGQFVSARMKAEDGSNITRAWSLSRFEPDPSSYRLTVRRQEGPGSRRLHELREGDSVDLRAPTGEFVLDPGGFRPVVMIAAGIGVTPLKAMLDAHLNRRDAPSVRFIYGGQYPDSLAFREELEQLAQAYDNLELCLTYSRADIAGAARGRITADLVIAQLQDLKIVVAGTPHVAPWYETDIYICGPDELCRELRDALVQRGINADRVFHELFTTISAEATDIAEAQVTFARSELQAIWKAEDDMSLLELAEAHGVAISSSCRAGSCLTCKSGLISGNSTATIEDGTILACIARPTTAAIELDL